MHRTTTTATLLVTVAVSALSGCVTVQRPPAPTPPAAPSQAASVPRPDGSAEPQVVQAPAREALELINPSRRPKPGTHPPHRTPASPPQAAQPPAPRSHPYPHPHPEPRHPRRPRADLPDVAKSVPTGTADVCALAKKYGGWQPDSPQSIICGQAYGR